MLLCVCIYGQKKQVFSCSFRKVWQFPFFGFPWDLGKGRASGGNLQQSGLLKKAKFYYLINFACRKQKMRQI